MWVAGVKARRFDKMIKKSKLVCGIGVNDADYPVTKHENGKQVWMCPYYRAWYNMLVRSYNPELKKVSPTYQDATVCEEWHSFMNFRSWMIQQDWEGKELDKDILFEGNKAYSPDTCVFVDKLINSFILDSKASRGEWPLGVSWKEKNGKFQCQCNNPFTKEREYLGLFHCPNQAHKAWKARKHELACQLADKQTDKRVAEALRTRYK